MCMHEQWCDRLIRHVRTFPQLVLRPAERIVGYQLHMFAYCERCHNSGACFVSGDRNVQSMTVEILTRLSRCVKGAHGQHIVVLTRTTTVSMFLSDKFCSAKMRGSEVEQGRVRWIVPAKATSHAPQGTQGNKESKKPRQATNSIRVSFYVRPGILCSVAAGPEKACPGEWLLVFPGLGRFSYQCLGRWQPVVASVRRIV